MRIHALLLAASAMLAACASTAPAPPQLAQAETPLQAQWALHRIRTSFVMSRQNSDRVLKRLGARDVKYTGLQVTFKVLVPARNDNPDVTDPRIVEAHWKNVTFRANSSTTIYRDGIDGHVYEELEDSILHAFTTRNFSEQTGRRLSVDVLFPVGE